MSRLSFSHATRAANIHKTVAPAAAPTDRAGESWCCVCTQYYYNVCHNHPTYGRHLRIRRNYACRTGEWSREGIWTGEKGEGGQRSLTHRRCNWSNEGVSLAKRMVQQYL